MRATVQQALAVFSHLRIHDAATLFRPKGIAVKKKFEWLEAMRGIAATWVLAHHAHQATAGFAGPLGPSWQAMANGFMGVDFFFVLSGFIIATSSEVLAASGRGLREYCTARAVRIYVPYLPVGLAMFLLYAALPGWSQGIRGDLSLLTSAILLPSDAPPALSVAWTLVHEIIFYAIFSVFFVSRRLLATVLAGWAIAIVGTWAMGVKPTLFWLYFLNPLNLCFVWGVGLAWLTRGGIGNRLAIPLGLIGLVLVLSQALAEAPNRPMLAAGFGALVLAARSPLLLSRSPGPVLLALGAASYAIYLVHNPVLSVLVRLVHGGPVLVFASISAGALLAGIAYHFIYERAALRKVRGLVSARPRALPSVDGNTGNRVPDPPLG